MKFCDTSFDTRHNLPTAIKRPRKKVDGEPLVVCAYYCHSTENSHGCGKLMSDFEWKRYGKCPRCNNRYIAGSNHIPLRYKIRFYFWAVLQNWRALGNDGWGWRVPFRTWLWNKVRGK